MPRSGPMNGVFVGGLAATIIGSLIVILLTIKEVSTTSSSTTRIARWTTALVIPLLLIFVSGLIFDLLA